MMESQGLNHPNQDVDDDTNEDNNNEVTFSPSSSVSSTTQPTLSRVLSPDSDDVPPVPVASSSPLIKQGPALVQHINRALPAITYQVNNDHHQNQAANNVPKVQESEVGQSNLEETPVASSSSVGIRAQDPPQKRSLLHSDEQVEVVESGSPIFRSKFAAKRRLEYQDQERTKSKEKQNEEATEANVTESCAVTENIGVLEEDAGVAKEEILAVANEVGGTTEGKEAKKPKVKKKRISSTKRAGLVFSVSRFNKRLKAGRYARRVGVTAGVYTASVLEYLVAEVLELAGNCARYFRKQRIFPRCIQLTLLHDKELFQLTRGAIVPQGGVKPFIHPALTGVSGVTGGGGAGEASDAVLNSDHV